jgi:hypothetical protein
MTKSIDIEGLKRQNAEAADDLRKNLAKVGNEYHALEAALTAKREERLAAMVAASNSGLLTNEEIWQVARAARTTLYNELQRLGKDETP